MASKHMHASRNTEWSFEERTGGELSSASNRIVPRVRSVLANNDSLKSHPEDGYLNLFYFSRLPQDGALGKKTILFVGGGPGSIILPDDPDDAFWLGSLPEMGSGFNVVYFHLRGSGYSQIPASNEFDRFLRTKFAVEDLEDIRKDLFHGKPQQKWDAVVGHSYGSILAHRYAAEYPDAVDKLVLTGAISLHEFRGSGNADKAYESYGNSVNAVRRGILDKLFELREFDRVRDKERIRFKLFGDDSQPGIFQIIEDNFISDQFLIDNYNDRGVQRALQQCGLGGFTIKFFMALRQLRKLGWSPITIQSNERDNLVDAGKTIVDDLRLSAKKLRDAAYVETYRASEFKPRRYSLRVLYVMGVYDGLNRKFLTHWLTSDRRNFRESLTEFPGKAHIAMGGMEPLEKIGIVEADIPRIEAWDPAQYPHSVPTLILNGASDVVTAGYQGKRYYDCALNGPRFFIDIDGAGHDFLLPDVNVPTKRLDRICGRGNCNTIDCIVSAFVELPPKEFDAQARKVYGKLEAAGLVVSTARKLPLAS
jgi:pimeloyl-ACP methyl ester carboxylesterase